MANEERLKELMTTLDDAWNAQDLDTFAQRHKADTVVRWPGQDPTHGIDAHRQEAIDFFNTFPDQHLDNRPYKVLIADGDWTCSVAHFTGTMTGPMKGSGGSEIEGGGMGASRSQDPPSSAKAMPPSPLQSVDRTARAPSCWRKAFSLSWARIQRR